MKKKIQTIILVFIAAIAIFTAYKIFYKVEDKQSIKRSRVFITGNIHGKVDIDKISSENFKEQKFLTSDDNLIILGDFGLVWDGSLEDELILDELSKKKFRILFVDGTHENFNLLNEYPKERMYGGVVTKIRDNIFMLNRGEIYLIDNKSFFVLGGGISDDKEYRKDNVSLWNEEMPSNSELENALNNLSKHGNAVDYILTHTPPANDLKIIGASLDRVLEPNSLNVFLQELSEKVKYKKWFHGYYHLDRDITRKHVSIFNDILEIK